MSKVRVYEVAKQLNLDPKQVVTLFQAIGINEVRNHMSSVEPEAVERVKRHLEKQKTHNVVEERIRPTVVKRRAVAKPNDTASHPAAAAPPSAPAFADVESSRHIPAAAASSPSGAWAAAESNGTTEVVRDRESARHHSVRDVEAASAHVPPPPPSRHSEGALRVDADRRSTRDLQAVVHEEPIPAERKSSRHVAAASVAEEIPTTMRTDTVTAPAAPAPSVREIAAALTVDEPMPSSEPPAAVWAAEPAPTPAPIAASPDATAPARASTAPKTGVEYWTGRPGVPMPTPVNAPRTGIGGGPIGTNARRVQYDPRAGSTGPGVRRDVRAGGPQQGRSMMRGAGGAGARGRMGSTPMRRPPANVSTQEMSAHKKVIRIDENITLQGMAQKLSLKSTELLMKLLSMGMRDVHINTTLDADTAKLLASEFGWEVEDVAVSDEAAIAAARGEETAAAGADIVVDPELELRPPVVTVMGHVDHGKTSLLDKIRKANVAGGEAGGITQHIGAYKVTTAKGSTVFLDTPGHEAFTQMRARGASVTDIVVLVVAADDGVMPQTREAVNHAKSAKVPIIVAVNKIDKPAAEPERVRRELVEMGLQPEEWGGDTIFVNVSAQTGEGIDTLLEMIALQSEVLDLKANPKKAASGTVLEALLDRGRGPVARVLVQDGTLRVGDFLLAGAGFGKVRAMTNEHGKNIHEAGPATPVEILGLSDVPGAGDQVHVVKDAKKAQEIAESRKGKMAKSLIPATAKVSLEELSKRISETGQQELRVLIKGDVQGSIEAVAEALAKLSTDKVRLSIIHAGVGAITENDVNLAIAAKAVVIGFNVRPAGKASAHAEENKIEIRLYSIIYNAVDDVKGAMEGLLPATLVEKANGKAEVRAVFKIKGVAVAGSMVTQGQVKRGGQARLIRDGASIWDGKVAALKRFKEDVKDVQEGFECGISLDGFNDFKEKDIIESYEIEAVKQKL